MDNFTIIIDTREQLPIIPKGISIIRDKLETGDYSINGFRDKITIERKSPEDFLQSISWDRPRFKKVLERMSKFERAYLLIESSLESLLEGIEIKKNFKSENKIKPLNKQKIGVHPESIFGTIISINVRFGIPVIFAKNKHEAQKYLVSILQKYYLLKRNNEI